ncbi:hypothetical protein D9613_004480 [Agrocybe pediades]|uniref:F-box domain-containing protein n=1 Tax=Agrocybe pediades TaxID=84607 RepID=A0A8H4QKK1_9AGAR|nr:hypothetical protein D9613_004480 [Agrocybe pediades]
MTCSHCKEKQSSSQRDFIDLSHWLKYKSECPFKEGACEPCQKKIEAEKDVVDAIAHLKDMLSRYQQVKTEMNHAHSPIIRDLPVEILSNIFYSCLSEGIAWTTPELWTVILVKARCPTPSSWMKEWFRRSGTLPVYVFIVEDHAHAFLPGRARCDYWETCFKMLEQYCVRWKDLSLNLSWASYQYIATKLKLKPSMRRLTLDISHYSSEDLEWELWQDSAAGPEHVRLNRGIRLGQFKIDWRRVTHVESHTWTPEECVSLLRNAPLLESCSFVQVINSPTSRPEQLQAVCHTSLRHLSIRYGGPPARLFDHLTLPSLNTLCYWSNGYFNPTTGHILLLDQGLHSLFRRSRFPLKKLTFVARAYTIDSLITTLNFVPSLTHLSLQFFKPEQYANVPVVEDLLEQLSASTVDIGDRFLPLLETLEVGLPKRFFPWGSLPDVFVPISEEYGSMAGQRPLKSIIVQSFSTVRAGHDGGLCDDVVCRLVRLQEAGIHVSARVTSKRSTSTLVPVKWEVAGQVCEAHKTF